MRVPEQTNCSRMARPCRDTWAGNSPGAASLPPRIRPVGPTPAPGGFGTALDGGRKPALAWWDKERMRRSRYMAAATAQIAAAARPFISNMLPESSEDTSTEGNLGRAITVKIVGNDGTNLWNCH